MTEIFFKTKYKDPNLATYYVKGYLDQNGLRGKFCFREFTKPNNLVPFTKTNGYWLYNEVEFIKVITDPEELKMIEDHYNNVN